jgi:hypothetical protein
MLDYLRLTGCPRKHRAAVAATYLERRAELAWWREADRRAAAGEPEPGWPDFAAFMAASFPPGPWRARARAALDRAAMRGGDFDGYLSRFEALCYRAGAGRPDGPSEAEIIHLCLKGLPAAIRDACLYNPRTAAAWASFGELRAHAGLVAALKSCVWASPGPGGGGGGRKRRRGGKGRRRGRKRRRGGAGGGDG